MRMMLVTFSLRSVPRAAALALLLTAGCADEAGSEVDCPVCDNTTELLVGSRCAPIAEVAECGPDGHAHGAECHCFSGQEPTTIGGKGYCLQAACGTSAPPDLDAEACTAVAGEAEPATAVATFAEFKSVHLHLGEALEVTLPAGVESFAHAPATGAGHLRIALSAAGVLDAALDATGAALEMEGGLANEDCAVALPALYEVHLEEGATYPHPVVLRFKAGTVEKVRLVIQHEAGSHEE